MASLLFAGARSAFATARPSFNIRMLNTLKSNPYIYYFAAPEKPGSHILTLLDTEPPTPELALGVTTEIPPTPNSFHENKRFLNELNYVLKENAYKDPRVQSEAATMASSGGMGLESAGMSVPGRTKSKGRKASQEDSAGGASAQGGIGSGNRGGFVHVTDERCPPAFGRVAWPENIFGSIEVNGDGQIDGNGNYQPSGAYRIVTNDGILGLTPFLAQKMKDHLRKLEIDMGKGKK